MPTIDWLNRDAALSKADQVPYRLLNHVSTHGDGGGNLLIQGDNLEALKSWRTCAAAANTARTGTKPARS